MFENLSAFLVQALILVVVIGLIWLGLRFVFRLTKGVFAIGCGVIVLLGACYLVFRLVF
ncbi:MAG TPA: hypothetical protein VJ768_03600 [Anaerolineales bacterium]|nr:hypothetical protein [Anaerolineales bacterium]